MSKITRRSYGRKKVVMGAALFGAIGLVSTGFAAWVLTSPAQKVLDPAGLSVGEVSDKNMEFVDVHIYLPNTDTQYDHFHFEPAAGDNSGRVRIGGTQAESLGLSVAGQLTRVQNLGEITAHITLSNADKTKLDSAVSKGYIVAPEAYVDSPIRLWDKNGGTPIIRDTFTCNQGAPDNAGDVTMSFAYDVHFAWGSAFDGKNPSIFFDEEAQASIPTGTPNDELSTGTVGAILKDMHDLLDNIQLTLTLVANPD